MRKVQSPSSRHAHLRETAALASLKRVQAYGANTYIRQTGQPDDSESRVMHRYPLALRSWRTVDAGAFASQHPRTTACGTTTRLARSKGKSQNNQSEKSLR